MSTFPNILPVASPGSHQNGDGPTNQPETQTGITGLFEKLMAKALSPTSTESEEPEAQNIQSHILIQPLKMAGENPNLPPEGVPFQTNLKNNLNTTEATGKGATPAQTNVAQSGYQTSSGPITKATGHSKTEKNSKPQTETTTANFVMSPEIMINHMLAAAIPTASPIIAQTNPETLPGTPVSSRPQITTKLTTIGGVSPQGKQASTAVTKISASDLPEEKDIMPVQPVASAKADLIETKNVELLAKNSEESNATDTAETTSSKTAGALGSESSASDPSDTSSGTATAPQPISNGTSIANQDIPMKQVEKTNKIAGQTEKVLPGDAISMARGGSTSAYSPNAGQMTTTTQDNNLTSGGSTGVSGMSVDSTVVPTTASLRGRMLERTQEMVALNAVRLSDSGNNSMQVVIKPDAGTQLSLELRQQGGSVQVQAVLQQGDFNHLSQQWPELQQRLDQRGIQLAPLNDEGASANSSGNHETFQQKQSQPTEVVPEITLAEAPAGMFVPEPAQTPSHRGWETWA
jgi:hypothetical protein